MRGIRLSRGAIGFAILTTLLSLTFIVSIVYAAGHGGVQNNVSWYVEVNSLTYDRGSDVTKSNHSVYVWNGGGASVFVDYEFKHQVDSDPGKTLRDQGWFIEVKPGNDPSNPFFHSNTITRSAADLGRGWHTLDAYTRVAVRSGVNRPPFIQDQVGEPTYWFFK